LDRLTLVVVLSVGTLVGTPLHAQTAGPDPAYITEPNRLPADDMAAILDVIARMNHAIAVNEKPAGDVSGGLCMCGRRGGG
jgi:hypothetical protein